MIYVHFYLYTLNCILKEWKGNYERKVENYYFVYSVVLYSFLYFLIWSTLSPTIFVVYLLKYV